MTALHASPVLGLIALWSGRPYDAFPVACPPCDATGNASADRVLAAVFLSIAQEPDSARQRLHVQKIGYVHVRHLSRALAADPSRNTELAPWLALLDVLEAWERALMEAA